MLSVMMLLGMIQGVAHCEGRAAEGPSDEETEALPAPPIGAEVDIAPPELLGEDDEEETPVPFEAAELRLARDDDEGQQGRQSIGHHLRIDKVVN